MNAASSSEGVYTMTVIRKYGSHLNHLPACNDTPFALLQAGWTTSPETNITNNN